MRRPHKIENIFLLDLMLLSIVKTNFCSLLRKPMNGFFQNLGKDCIQTNMHITVKVNICSAVYSQDRRLAKWSIGCYQILDNFMYRHSAAIKRALQHISYISAEMQDLLGHFMPFSKDQRYRNLPIHCKKIWINARLKLHHLLH